MTKEFRFYCPHYWPFWFCIGVWRLLIFLPYRVQLMLGRFLGCFLHLWNTRLKRITQTNIALCFPALNRIEQQVLVRKHFISLGIAFFETGLAWFGSDRQVRRLGHYYGFEHFERYQKQGQGVLLVGEHFSTIEIIGRLFAQRYEFGIIYRPHKKPFINFLFSRFRARHYQHVFERQNVRGIVKALRRGLSIWYTPDIDAGYYEHCFIPFFGVQAATLTAPVRLMKLGRANMISCAYYRRDDGTGYDLIGHPVWDRFPSNSLEKDLLQINQFLEEVIRKKPEQYLWSYARFKTRPKGEARFYKS